MFSLLFLLSAGLVKPVGLKRQEERNHRTSRFLESDPLSHVTATTVFKPQIVCPDLDSNFNAQWNKKVLKHLQ